jgi:uncharacterized protein
VQHKPVDVGNGLVVASFGLDGSLLSVTAPHREAGVVELTGAPVFPIDRDGDGDAVRRHRADLTDPAYAVLRPVEVRGALASLRPAWRWDGPGWVADVDAWAVAGRPSIVQRIRVQGDRAGRLRLRFAGRLDRPAYAEITPGGPIPPAWTASRVSATGSSLVIATESPDPAASAVVSVEAAGVASAVWSPRADASADLDLTWAADGPTELEALVTFTLPPLSRRDCTNVPPPDARTAPAPSPGGTFVQSRREGSVLERVTDGAGRYVRGCTALAVGAEQCCLVTDHRLLPLSWTRDAYYQAALLLCLADGASVDVVRRHLAWLWSPGRDDTGVWRRSHDATGAVKDTAYQADQQLYPLLELADYRRVVGAWPDPAAWGERVRRVWRQLPYADSGLLPGEENPADDPSTLPYLLSSQLLLAYTARRLAEWERELGIEDLRLGERAEGTLTAVRAAFGCDGPYGPQWAYESDGRDGRRRYHDANDVPTALAPLWGLCEPEDPVWRATMRFAWSPDNPGYVAGRLAGLGSRHTPGVWPLGDAQEWAVATLTGDRAAARRVLTRLDHVASDDGMLPETYDPTTGAWLARHWFAWPGALVGALHLTVRDGIGPWASEAHF